MQLLNVYADQLAQGHAPSPTRLEFYIRQGDGHFSHITADLPSTGSLSPLFFAFALISEEDVRKDLSSAAAATTDSRDLYEWLSQVAAEAALAADQHDALKKEVRSLRSALEDRFSFASVDVGGEYSLAAEAQRQQRDALSALQQGLSAIEDKDVLSAFAGLRLRLYHPDAAPLVTVGYQDPDGTYNVRSEPMQSYIAENGVVHLVAPPDNPPRVLSSLQRLDLSRAQLLSKVSSYWHRRSRELSGALKALLGVENVWFDARGEEAAQKFVLWAGAILERREEIGAALGGRSFAFSVLVHSDDSSPLLDFIESSSVLQSRTDCPPRHLLAFMVSESGELANETATLVADTRAEESAALEAVRKALGAKHVVRVCSSYDQRKVLEAAARLVEAAPSIRAAVDLSGVSLAIDDCYDVWETGFISIPFDFSMADLEPKLQALLVDSSSSGSDSSGSGSSSGVVNGSEVMLGGGGAVGSQSVSPRTNGIPRALLPHSRHNDNHRRYMYIGGRNGNRRMGVFVGRRQFVSMPRARMMVL